MDISQNINWYVARIKPGETTRALHHLNMNSVFHLYPIANVLGIEQPIIPGYVFVSLSGTDDDFALVNDTDGIDQLLPIRSENPSRVPTAWMRNFEQRLLDGEFDVEVERNDKPLPWFKRKEILGITSGPFSGHTGTFVRVHKGAVIVEVQFFGRPLEVTLKGHQVQQLI